MNLNLKVEISIERVDYMCDGREKDVYRFMKLMADDCEDKQKCSVEISKERFGRKNCKGKVILLKFLKF